MLIFADALILLLSDCALVCAPHHPCCFIRLWALPPTIKLRLQTYPHLPNVSILSSLLTVGGILDMPLSVLGPNMPCARPQWTQAWVKHAKPSSSLHILL